MPIEIVDAHHHLWDTDHLHYTLFDSLPALRRPYTISDFEPLAEKNRVSASVCVEAASAGTDGWQELLWILEQARRSRVVKRIVAWAPVDQPDVAPYLERLAGAAGGLVVGVRRSFEFEASEFPASDAVIAGIKAIAGYGYSFDLVLFERSLAAVIQLVESCPEVQFILDHLGKPRIREGIEQPWKQHIAQLAELLPNVVLKVSGLSTEADRVNWTKEQLRPYIDHAIGCFGWDRVLFGSDWPVCTLARGYDPWLETVFWATSGADESDRCKLFSENAKRVYRF
jgi:L-fuconolactonase